MRSLLHSIPRALRGLRRNWRWACNSVLIVASAISVLGMIVLLYVNVQHAAQFWLSNTSVSVFLEPGLDEAQRDRLLEQATTHPLVRQARLVTPAEGLAALSERLGTAQGLFTRQDADTLPYTIDLEIFVDFRDRIGTVARAFAALPGVEDVVYAERVLDKVNLFFLITRAIGLFFIGLILASFCLIIANAIKLSMHARLAEIQILSLVGATRTFIRLAFVLEGMVISLAGGLLSLLLVWSAYELLMAGLTWDAFTRGLREITVFYDWPMLAGALGLITLLGAASSHVSVTRVLRSLEP